MGDIDPSRGFTFLDPETGRFTDRVSQDPLGAYTQKSIEEKERNTRRARKILGDHAVRWLGNFQWPDQPSFWGGVYELPSRALPFKFWFLRELEKYCTPREGEERVEIGAKISAVVTQLLNSLGKLYDNGYVFWGVHSDNLYVVDHREGGEAPGGELEAGDLKKNEGPFLVLADFSALKEISEEQKKKPLPAPDEKLAAEIQDPRKRGRRRLLLVHGEKPRNLSRNAAVVTVPSWVPFTVGDVSLYLASREAVMSLAGAVIEMLKIFLDNDVIQSAVPMILDEIGKSYSTFMANRFSADVDEVRRVFMTRLYEELRLRPRLSV